MPDLTARKLLLPERWHFYQRRLTGARSHRPIEIINDRTRLQVVEL